MSIPYLTKRQLGQLLVHRQAFSDLTSRPPTREGIIDYFKEYGEEYERDNPEHKHALYFCVCQDLGIIPVE